MSWNKEEQPGIIIRLEGDSAAGFFPGDLLTFIITVTLPYSASSMTVTAQLSEGLECLGSESSRAAHSQTDRRGAWWVFSGVSAADAVEMRLQTVVGPGLTPGQDLICQVTVTDTDAAAFTPGFATFAVSAGRLTIDKQCTPDTATIGEEVQFEACITVPPDTVAFDVQLVDEFPGDLQVYIEGSSRLNGDKVSPIADNGKLLFPVLPFVEAEGKEITLCYCWRMRVVDSPPGPSSCLPQADEATVYWGDQAGKSEYSVSASALVNVCTPLLQLQKDSCNITQGTGWDDAVKSFAPGDMVGYRITVRSAGQVPAFGIRISDLVDSRLTILLSSVTASIGSVEVDGHHVNWAISCLAPGENAVLSFRMLAAHRLPAGLRVVNQAVGFSWTQPRQQGKRLGPWDSNQVILVASSVAVAKIVSPPAALIGADVDCEVTVTIPRGTAAYRLTLEDALPDGQTYLGPATVKIGSGPFQTVVPSVSGHTLTFPEVPALTAGSSDLAVLYRFKVRVVSAHHVPPYRDRQVNVARVRWSVIPGGHPAKQARCSAAVTVATPCLEPVYEQANQTHGDEFTTGPITAYPYNTVIYRLLIVNCGAAAAYNIRLDQVLDERLSFLDIVLIPPGAEFHPPAPGPGGNWRLTIPCLEPESAAEFQYRVKIGEAGIGPHPLAESIAGTYDSSPAHPVVYPMETGPLLITSGTMTNLVKTLSAPRFVVGDLVIGTLRLSVPPGETVYQVTVADTLPLHQEFAGRAWRDGVPVPVHQEGQVVTFPVEDIIEGGTSGLTVDYALESRITAAPGEPPYWEEQTNTGKARWSTCSHTPPGCCAESSASLVAARPFVHLTKLQANRTIASEVTDQTLPVWPGDKVEFILRLDNTAQDPAVDILVTDALAECFEFMHFTEVSSGTADYDPALGRVSWTIAGLEREEGALASFLLRAREELPRDATNTGTVAYSSPSSPPFPLPPQESNLVRQIFPVPGILLLQEHRSLTGGQHFTAEPVRAVQNNLVQTRIILTNITPDTIDDIRVTIPIARPCAVKGKWSARPAVFSTRVPAPEDVWCG